MRMARIVAVVGVGAALFGAPVAHADPEDLVPYCSGNDLPELDNCRLAPHQSEGPETTGTDPNVGTGTDPGLEPLI